MERRPARSAKNGSHNKPLLVRLFPGGFNRPLLILSLTLFLVGALMVYSASAVIATGEGRSAFHYFFLQLAWVAVALVVCYLVYRIPLDLIAKSSVPIMLVSLVLLFLVLVIGKNLNGATRWIDLGPFDLQPSEVAKLGFTIYLSAWLSRKRPTISNLRDAVKMHLYEDLLPFMGLLLLVTGLIILQPDLDTALIIAATALTVYFVSGKDAIHTLGTIFILASTAIMSVFAAILAPYRLQRVMTYLNFLTTGSFGTGVSLGAGFQIRSCLIGISSGGLMGLGYGESRQKLYYLQNAAFTDSIFCVIGEEFGLFGSLILIIAFLYFMSIGVGIAYKAPTKFASLLAIGITTWITIQAFLNIGANLALIPFGGIPLPFITYGGSNTIAIAAGVGLLLNISRHSSSKAS